MARKIDQSHFAYSLLIDIIRKLTNRMWFSVVCTLIDNDIRRHSGQNVVRLMSPQQILTTVMTNIVVDKSADNSKAHSICFLPQYQRQRKFL